MELKQKDMNLVEYAYEFDHTLRYTPLLVVTQEARVARFIYGLDHHISVHLVTHEKEPIKHAIILALRLVKKGVEFKAIKIIKNGV